MANPFGDPIASSVDTPVTNAVQTLSGLLRVKQQQQDLQTGQYLQQGAQAESQAKQQAMQERLSIQRMMQSGVDDQGNSLRGANGEPDPSKILPALGRIAPLTGQAYAQSILRTHTDRVGLQAASESLDSQGRAMLMGPVQAAANDPDATSASIGAGIDNLVKAHPEMENAAEYLKGLTAHWDNIPPENRAKAAQLLASRIQGGQPVQTQAAPGSIDTGGQIQPGTVAPAVAGGRFTPAGAPIQKQIPPGYMLGPNGQIVRADAAGLSLPNVSTAGNNGSQQSKLQPIARPGINAPAADIQNYNARIAALGDEYQRVSSAANDPVNGVQATRFRNQQILDLIQHTNVSGPGAPMLNSIVGRLPIVGRTMDSLQDLEHYTAQNSAAMAKQMGVPSTNLGAETAAAAAGNIQRNPGALREITRTNDALNTATDLYNRGLARVTNNGSDMSRAASYKQAFGQTLDLNAIRWADAHRRGDQEELRALGQKLGPQGIAAAQRRLQVLRSLSETGDLP